MPKTMAEVPSFLNEQWIATLATVDKQGKPHTVPVWFTFDQGKVHVQTDRKSVKVRNIQFNPNASVAVYIRDEAVILNGKAGLIDSEEDFRKLTQAHIDKYNRLFNIAHNTQGIEYIKLDAQGRDNMGTPLFNYTVRCIIEVVPEKMLFW
jgi:general stress protein 26